MSLSNLQAQLAALQQSDNAGSTFTSSRSHEEAVGRGLHFSTQHGHSLWGQKSDKYQASFLFETATEAADVPLRTLQEHALHACSVLQVWHPPLQDKMFQSKLFAPLDQQDEATIIRTIINDSKSIDMLHNLLALMSSLLLECDSRQDPRATACWYLLEFSLRRWKIHVTCPLQLLWTLLPIADKFPSRLHRGLLLIDFSEHQSYLWLRPYCRMSQEQLPPRTLVSQHVVQHLDTLQHVCQLTRHFVALHQTELAYVENDGNDDEEPRRGISLGLSFTALLIMQGISSKLLTTTNDHKESVLRILIPHVLASCSSNTSYSNPDFRAWGHVVVSTLAEHLDLAPMTLNLICIKMLATEGESLHNQADAVACVLSILMPPRKQIVNTNDADFATFLRVPANEHWLGCHLSNSTYKAFKSLDQLPEIIAVLRNDYHLVVEPLVASLCVQAMVHNDMDIILKLITKEELGSLWKRNSRSDLVASLATHLVILVCKNLETKSHTDIMEAGDLKHGIGKWRTVLQALHRLDEAACERGIVMAQSECLNVSTDVVVNVEERRVILTHLLQSILNLNVTNDFIATEMLPPRVALEHASAAVRSEAIERLLKVTSPDFALWMSLMRHWANDQDSAVALSAGQLLGTWMAQELVSLDQECSPNVVELALDAFFRHARRKSFSESVPNHALVTCLRAMAYIARSVYHLDKETPADDYCNENIVEDSSKAVLFARCISCLFFAVSYENLTNEVSCYILVALDSTCDLNETASSKQVQDVLLSHPIFVEGLHKLYKLHCKSKEKCSHKTRIEIDLCRRCVIFLLRACHESLRKEDLSQARAFGFCILDSTNKDATNFTEEENTLIKRYLMKAFSKETIDTDLVLALAATGTERAWSMIAEPLLKTLVEHGYSHTSGKMRAPLMMYLEAALRPCTDTFVILRLIERSVAYASCESCDAPWMAVILTFALLESPEDSVRVTAVKLTEAIGNAIPQAEKNQKSLELSDWSCLKAVCEQVASADNLVKLGGSSFLSAVLASCVGKCACAPQIQEAMPLLCFLTACGNTEVSFAKLSKIKSADYRILHVNAIGCFHAVTSVLNAMELAGESSFPLDLRWKHAGKPLLDALSYTESVDERVSNLIICTVRMLKGAKLLNPHIIIQSGPKSGGRSRSYSISRMDDGISFLSPYPSEMHNMIVRFLSCRTKNIGAVLVATAISEEVLACKSWCNEVYKNLSSSVKHDIAQSFLTFTSANATKLSEDLLLGLPLTAVDIVQLMDRCIKSANLINQSRLLEVVQTNAGVLSKDKKALVLLERLFEHMATLSLNPVSDKGTQEYVLQMILIASKTLLEQIPITKPLLIVHDEKLATWNQLLLNLLGSDLSTDQKQPRRLETFHSRSACFSLMAALCVKFPEQSVSSLVPAAMTAIATTNVTFTSRSSVRDAFVKTVPTFLKYALIAGLSTTHFFVPFVGCVSQLSNESGKKQLYRDLADAIFIGEYDSTAEEKFSLDSCLGALLSFFLADKIFQSSRNDGVGDDSVNFAVTLLSEAKESVQIPSLLLLLNYAKDLLSSFQKLLSSDFDSRTGLSLLPTYVEIGRHAAVGRRNLDNPEDFDSILSTSDSIRRVRFVVLAILQVFRKGLNLESIKRFIEKGDSVVSSLALRLWQDLLHIQSESHILVSNCKSDDSNSSFQTSVVKIVSESREYLQSILPVHVFLASVSCLIQDNHDIEIRSRALRLVADRISCIDSATPEAILFEDILPITLEIILCKNCTDESSLMDNAIVIQNAVVATEHIARSFASRRSEEKDSRKIFGFSYFLKILRACADLLLSCEPLIARNSVSDLWSHDLMSSTALCCATLITSIGASCLPILPRLMKPLILLLQSTNSNIPVDCVIDDNRSSRCRISQLSIMRALVSIVETTPQFVSVFLSDLLSSVLLSESLRNNVQDSDISIDNIVSRFDAALSSRIAPRLLIPAVEKAMLICNRAAEIRTLLSILKSSVVNAASPDVAHQKDSLLNSLTRALEFDVVSWTDRSLIIGATCDLIEVAVLKLSEVQLQRIFAALTSWRGEIDPRNPEHLALRRAAFWTVTERLSKELRSLFLPCLSSVIDDLIAELNIAVNILCHQQHAPSKKKEKDSKRQKLEIRSNVYSADAMRFMHPVLSTLENALRSDAYQGGSWIRANDNDKYENILEPLGKLLRARVPDNYPLQTSGNTSEMSASINPFVTFIHDANGGSVVACLVALGVAGGNEQLWKPLNHAVLKACGAEGRAEVRRAGLICMLELIKSLGEEYMVLLPENLPVLAELLEDSDEEVSGLAKKVVVVAEELIGESLEDSLR